MYVPSYRFGDYVTMGLDADGVYLATNNFGGPTGFDVSIYSIPKADLLLPTPTRLSGSPVVQESKPAPRGTSPPLCAHAKRPSVSRS